MVCGSWSGCAVGRELKEEMMEGRKKSEERRVKKDDKKNKNKKLGNGYGE